jgi:hypothetical protein
MDRRSGMKPRQTGNGSNGNKHLKVQKNGALACGNCGTSSGIGKGTTSCPGCKISFYN